TVASATSFIPVVDVVAAPIAVAAGAVEAYKDASSGNYVAAALDSVGVVGSGFAIAARAESEAWSAAARALWTQSYMQRWATDEALTWALRWQGASLASFALSGPL